MVAVSYLDVSLLLLGSYVDELSVSACVSVCRPVRCWLVCVHAAVVRCVCVCVRVQTSQVLVGVRPCSSRALCLLGSAQLALSDCLTVASDAASLLDDAKQSFSASIALEGAPAAGEPRPEITGLLPLLTYLRLTVILLFLSLFSFHS